MSRKLALQLSISLCDCLLRIDVHVCVRVCDIRVILSSSDSMTLPIKRGVILSRRVCALDFGNDSNFLAINRGIRLNGGDVASRYSTPYRN